MEREQDREDYREEVRVQLEGPLQSVNVSQAY